MRHRRCQAAGAAMARCRGLGLAPRLAAPPKAARRRPRALAVLDRFAGTWDVTATTGVPRLAPVTSSFAWAWVLDRRYLRGESGIKSDGSQELQVLGHDAGGYRCRSSSRRPRGELPRGEWNEATATMAWKNAPSDPILLHQPAAPSKAAATMRCSAQVKNLAASSGSIPSRWRSEEGPAAAAMQELAPVVLFVALYPRLIVAAFLTLVGSLL